MVKVLGVCSKHPKMKKYILWALRLLEDMNFICDLSSEILQGYDVVIVD
jgi:hypothetical protein